MKNLAQRLRGVVPSPIAALSQAARDLRASGVDVIDLGVGEPDFDTPEHVKAATTEAMRRGETKYTPINGGPALRKAIADKFQRENGLTYALDEIAVSSGAKQIIFNAMMATLDPGDEVIVPAPYWASYPDIIRFAGATPVVVAGSEEDGFALRPDLLEKAITKRTKWLFLNSPNNPSGAYLDREQLRAVADVLLAHPDIWVLSDDIYEHLLFDGRRFATIAQVEPKLRERTVTMNGVSKTYAMTGWRLGYAGAPAEMIAAMSNVQSQCTTHASSLSQAGALAALTGPQDFLTERVASLQERRDLVVERISAIDGLRCRKPEGAFYVFLDCRGIMGRKAPNGRIIENCSDAALFLLESARVSVVPGSVFGTPGYLRLSTATARDQLTVACDRIAQACADLG
ncbi:MAG: pyridoxal phosphate-dependent aminotransferase [Salinarimonadaceae bacterium]|nr:MAG: pyridoxal phosphate-dependent aminotransferase [Salinarimonadaceae bacterium]